MTRWGDEVVCWGDNSGGQLLIPLGLPSLVGLSLGNLHACGWTDSGEVTCFGGRSPATPPPGTTGVAGVASGVGGACAFSPTTCWGTMATGSPAFLSTAVGASFSTDFYCAWNEAGAVLCWGEDGDGQASPPGDLLAVSKVSTGNSHACALEKRGSVRCWGDADWGALAVPAAVGSDALQLEAGFGSACALVKGGTVLCWGRSTYTSVPSEAVGVDGIASAMDSYCAWKTTGAVVCWGDNDLGQGMVPFHRLTLPYIRSIQGSIGAGTHFFCALLSNTTTTTTSTITSTTWSSSSTSTSSSSSTSTATTTVPPPPNPTAVMGIANPVEENSIVSAASRTPSASDPVVRKVHRATLVAMRIGTGSSDEVLVLDLGNNSHTFTSFTHLIVTLPASIAQLLQGAVLVASITDGPVAEQVVKNGAGGVDAEGAPCRFYGAVSLRVVFFGQKPTLPGANFSEPFFLKLPTPHLPAAENWLEMVCAWWNETGLHWSLEGVETLSTAGEQLLCSVDFSKVPIVQGTSEGAAPAAGGQHPSLFAGIVRGFIRTLLCTNVVIFTSDGLKNLGDPSFLAQPVVAVYTGVQAVLLVLFVAACIVDYRRARRDVWGDERWLVPVRTLTQSRYGSEQSLSLGSYSSFYSEEEEEQQQQQCTRTRTGSSVQVDPTASQPSRRSTQESMGMMGQESTGRTSRVSKRQTVTEGAVATVNFMGQLNLALVNWCKQSAAVRDAVDDVCSRWFAYFSEIRDFVEGMCQSLSGPSDEEEGRRAGQTRMVRLANNLLSNLLAGSARRHAAISLGVSAEMVNFVLDDERLKGLLVDAALPSLESLDPPPWQQRLLIWLELHEKVIAQIDHHWNTPANWLELPKTAMHFFIVANPVSAVFLSCGFMKCHVKVLLLSAELLGSVMTASLFFQATGSMTGKRSRGECAGSSDISELFGRLIAIGIAALFVAYLPVCLLASLQSRGLKRFGSEKSKQWLRQVRIWRVQDQAVVVIGMVYSCFCSFFTFSFLANVSPQDLPSWALTTGTSFVEDIMVIPLGVGLIVPFAAMGALSLGSFLNKEERSELLRQRRAEKEAKGWYKVITDI